MLSLGHGRIRTCAGVSRRSLLTVGGVGWLGCTLADAVSTRVAASTSAASGKGPNNCIFIFLNGGPSQYETFDPKPDTPVEIRGPYGAIETNVSGIRISELLPNLSGEMDKFCILRSHT